MTQADIRKALIHKAKYIQEILDFSLHSYKTKGLFAKPLIAEASELAEELAKEIDCEIKSEKGE